MTIEQRVAALEMRQRGIESRVGELEDKDDGLEPVEVEVACSTETMEDMAYEMVDNWLTRAKGLGHLTLAEAAVVERLLEDLR